MAEDLVIDGHYECLWWSDEQMAGLNPNNPPSKNTIQIIDHWEYSDPVGVPHPDFVTLVLKVPNSLKGDLVVKNQWLNKNWSHEQNLDKVKILNSDESFHLVKVDIPVKDYIYKKHPKKMRSTIYLGLKKYGVFDLPIIIGD